MTAQSSASSRKPAPDQDPNVVTVFGRFNYKTQPTMNFDISPYTKVFNPDRKQAFVLKDAMIDPNLTILHEKSPKDPGYAELNKRSTRMHDLHSKVIHDNQNRTIIKVDESYGLVNGGIIG